MPERIIPQFSCFVLLLVALFVMTSASKETGRATEALKAVSRELAALKQQDRDHSNRIQEWEDMTYTHVVKLDAQLGNKDRLKAPPQIKGD